MKIGSRFFVSHHVPVRSWVKYHVFSLYHALPNKFTQPYRSEHDHIFVCGCGHSGTTLLAAKLGQHPEFLLIGRETETFYGTVSAHGGRRVVEEWDYFADELGKKAILEKTPKHIQYIPKIRKILPNSKVIIIARNPLDNISSLYKRFKNLDGCIGRWLADNSAALRHRDDPGVQFLTYESLVTQPKEILQTILEKAGYEWSDDILSGGSSAYGKSNKTGTMALRAQQVSQDITKNIGGWRSVFSEQEAEDILRRTQEISAQLGYPKTIREYEQLAD